ncbi:MAG: sigma 54-interacting transcriptional regulator [Fibrobacterales bacterium]
MIVNNVKEQRRNNKCPNRQRCESNELFVLEEIAEELNRSRDVEKILHILLTHMESARGTVTILNRECEEIFIEDACGLTEDEIRRGRYKIGEGVIGRAIETGESIVVPRISEEPAFLDKTRARDGYSKEDIGFICVPIKKDDEVLGALSVDTRYATNIPFNEYVRLLTAVGSMISFALQAKQEESERLEQLKQENERLNSHLQKQYEPKNIYGKSKAMREVYRQIELVAVSNATVLIRGENGVGKELVANAIHFGSKRIDGPFIKVNCAALPENLIETELFGHVKGAYTGAVNERVGRFELANRGTIFLDEIGDLPLSIQVKLLRIIQERKIERVGDAEPIDIDVRIVCATNRNLEEAMKSGAFREDLFYRLNVFPIHVPSLKERKSDITMLTDTFIEKFNNENDKRIKRISSSAIDMLMSYHWPGNVRELQNVIERAAILCDKEVIYSYHLPPTLQTPRLKNIKSHGTLDETIAKIEQELIEDALKMSKGNMTRAADALGITERMIGTRVRKYSIAPNVYKSM